jgi:hypothetical protein
MLIEFEMAKDGVVFRDAILLPDNHTLTAAQISAIKKQRFEAWLAATLPETQED